MSSVGGHRTMGRPRSRRAGGLALSAALLVALTPFAPSWADGEEATAGSSGEETGQGSVEESGEASGQESGEGTAEESGEGVSPEEPAPGDAGKDAGNGGGTRYGGRGYEPAPLVLLEPDPAHPVPDPPVNEDLPEAVDVQPPWQANVLCDPVDRPGVEAFGALLAHYDRPVFSTFRSCIDQKSEHYEGRALDWPLNAFDPADRRIGDAFVTWLTDNDGEMAARFGVQSIIWNERSWGSGERTWRRYAGQSAHTDHVHFSFTWDGAAMRTSWWTGIAVEHPDLGPCEVVAGTYAAIPQAPRLEECGPDRFALPDTGYQRVRPGGTGSGVDLVQPLLEVPLTGVLDDDTRAALLAWQAEEGLPTTGVLDQTTYARALGQELELPEEALAIPVPEFATTDFTPHLRTVLAEGDEDAPVEPGEEGEERDEAQAGPVAVLQEAIGAEPDGVFGPQTAEALRAYFAEEPLLADRAESEGEPRVTPLVWHLLERREAGTLDHRYVELERDAEGELVQLLQEHLGVEADGIFGPLTEEAVIQAQVAADLEPTGVVDGPTWAALDKGPDPVAWFAEQAAQASGETEPDADTEDPGDTGDSEDTGDSGETEDTEPGSGSTD